MKTDWVPSNENSCVRWLQDTILAAVNITDNGWAVQESPMALMMEVYIQAVTHKPMLYSRSIHWLCLQQGSVGKQWATDLSLIQEYSNAVVLNVETSKNDWLSVNLELITLQYWTRFLIVPAYNTDMYSYSSIRQQVIYNSRNSIKTQLFIEMFVSDDHWVPG